MAMSFEKTILVNDWGKEYEEHDLEKVQKTGWKTEDGKEFSSKEDAEEHERERHGKPVINVQRIKYSEVKFILDYRLSDM